MRREDTALEEANTLKIPIIALVDTNCNPEQVDYVIPANDDAIRAIKLLTGKIADACLEGVAMRKAQGDDSDETASSQQGDGRRGFTEEDDNEERLLGKSTLAKLQTSSFGDDDE